jgi:hypothetical protein
MLDILLLFATIPMSHIAQFALQEGSQYGWPNIRCVCQGILRFKTNLAADVRWQYLRDSLFWDHFF